jgi:hypothetical protein
LPGRLNSLTRLSSFRAITLIPSCLISCIHWSGALGARVGKQGGMLRESKTARPEQATAAF